MYERKSCNKNQRWSDYRLASNGLMFNQLIYDGADPLIIIRLAPGRQGLWFYMTLPPYYPCVRTACGLERINKDKQERKLDLGLISDCD